MLLLIAAGTPYADAAATVRGSIGQTGPTSCAVRLEVLERYTTTPDGLPLTFARPRQQLSMIVR
jgi:hypothetical protein